MLRSSTPKVPSPVVVVNRRPLRKRGADAIVPHAAELERFLRQSAQSLQRSKRMQGLIRTTLSNANMIISKWEVDESALDQKLQTLADPELVTMGTILQEMDEQLARAGFFGSLIELDPSTMTADDDSLLYEDDFAEEQDEDYVEPDALFGSFLRVQNMRRSTMKSEATPAGAGTNLAFLLPPEAGTPDRAEAGTDFDQAMEDIQQQMRDYELGKDAPAQALKESLTLLQEILSATAELPEELGTTTAAKTVSKDAARASNIIQVVVQSCEGLQSRAEALQGDLHRLKLQEAEMRTKVALLTQKLEQAERAAEEEPVQPYGRERAPTRTKGSIGPTAGSRLTRFASMAPPQGEVTLLFTDIEQSTFLWDNDAPTMKLALKEHNAILREALKENHGYEVKTEGDCFMVAFARSLDSVKFGISVQFELLKAKWPERLLMYPSAGEEVGPDGRLLWRGLRVRVGGHCGTPDAEADRLGRVDYFGPVVNLSARIAALGRGGEFIVSDTIYEAVKEHLAHLEHPASSSFAGLKKLKGIIAPRACYYITPTELAARFSGTGARRKSTANEDDALFAQSGMSRLLNLTMREQRKLETERKLISDTSKQVLADFAQKSNVDLFAWLAQGDGKTTVVCCVVEDIIKIWKEDSILLCQCLLLLSSAVTTLAFKYGAIDGGSQEDMYVFLFREPQQAVEFAIELHTVLLKVEWPDELAALPLKSVQARTVQPAAGSPVEIWRGLRLQIGVHTGHLQAFVESENEPPALKGDALVKAVQIATHCHGGETVISLVCFMLVRAFVESGAYILNKMLISKDRVGGKEDLLLFQVLPRLLEQRLVDFQTAAQPQTDRLALFWRTLESVDSVKVADCVEVVRLLREPAPEGLEAGRGVPPSGLVTLVIAQVQGFRELWAEDVLTTCTALLMYVNEIRGTAYHYGGYEVKHDSDAFEFAFPSPSTALEWACEFQERLLSLKWPHGFHENQLTTTRYVDGTLAWRGLRVKMGMHTAEYEPEGGKADYIGNIFAQTLAVNDLAYGGEILLTGDTFRHVKEAPHVDILFIGEKPSYGLAMPVSIYQALPMRLRCRRSHFPQQRNLDTTEESFIDDTRWWERKAISPRLEDRDLNPSADPDAAAKFRKRMRARPRNHSDPQSPEAPSSPEYREGGRDAIFDGSPVKTPLFPKVAPKKGGPFDKRLVPPLRVGNPRSPVATGHLDVLSARSGGSDSSDGPSTVVSAAASDRREKKTKNRSRTNTIQSVPAPQRDDAAVQTSPKPEVKPQHKPEPASPAEEEVAAKPDPLENYDPLRKPEEEEQAKMRAEYDRIIAETLKLHRATRFFFNSMNTFMDETDTVRAGEEFAGRWIRFMRTVGYQANPAPTSRAIRPVEELQMVANATLEDNQEMQYANAAEWPRLHRSITALAAKHFNAVKALMQRIKRQQQLQVNTTALPATPAAAAAMTPGTALPSLPSTKSLTGHSFVFPLPGSDVGSTAVLSTARSVGSAKHKESRYAVPTPLDVSNTATTPAALSFRTENFANSPESGAVVSSPRSTENLSRPVSRITSLRKSSTLISLPPTPGVMLSPEEEATPVLENQLALKPKKKALKSKGKGGSKKHSLSVSQKATRHVSISLHPEISEDFETTSPTEVYPGASVTSPSSSEFHAVQALEEPDYTTTTFAHHVEKHTKKPRQKQALKSDKPEKDTGVQVAEQNVTARDVVAEQPPASQTMHVTKKAQMNETHTSKVSTKHRPLPKKGADLKDKTKELSTSDVTTVSAATPESARPTKEPPKDAAKRPSRATGKSGRQKQKGWESWDREVVSLVVPDVPVTPQGKADSRTSATPTASSGTPQAEPLLPPLESSASQVPVSAASTVPWPSNDAEWDWPIDEDANEDDTQIAGTPQQHSPGSPSTETADRTFSNTQNEASAQRNDPSLRSKSIAEQVSAAAVAPLVPQSPLQLSTPTDPSSPNSPLLDVPFSEARRTPLANNQRPVAAISAPVQMAQQILEGVLQTSGIGSSQQREDEKASRSTLHTNAEGPEKRKEMIRQQLTVQRAQQRILEPGTPVALQITPLRNTKDSPSYSLPSDEQSQEPLIPALSETPIGLDQKKEDLGTHSLGEENRSVITPTQLGGLDQGQFRQISEQELSEHKPDVLDAQVKVISLARPAGPRGLAQADIKEKRAEPDSVSAAPIQEEGEEVIVGSGHEAEFSLSPSVTSPETKQDTHQQASHFVAPSPVMPNNGSIDGIHQKKSSTYDTRSATPAAEAFSNNSTPEQSVIATAVSSFSIVNTPIPSGTNIHTPNSTSEIRHVTSVTISPEAATAAPALPEWYDEFGTRCNTTPLGKLRPPPLPPRRQGNTPADSGTLQLEGRQLVGTSFAPVVHYRGPPMDGTVPIGAEPDPNFPEQEEGETLQYWSSARGGFRSVKVPKRGPGVSQIETPPDDLQEKAPLVEPTSSEQEQAVVDLATGLANAVSVFSYQARKGQGSPRSPGRHTDADDWRAHHNQPGLFTGGMENTEGTGGSHARSGIPSPDKEPIDMDGVSLEITSLLASPQTQPTVDRTNGEAVAELSPTTDGVIALQGTSLGIPTEAEEPELTEEMDPPKFELDLSKVDLAALSRKPQLTGRTVGTHRTTSRTHTSASSRINLQDDLPLVASIPSASQKIDLPFPGSNKPATRQQSRSGTPVGIQAAKADQTPPTKPYHHPRISGVLPSPPYVSGMVINSMSPPPVQATVNETNASPLPSRVSSKRPPLARHVEVAAAPAAIRSDVTDLQRRVLEAVLGDTATTSNSTLPDIYPKGAAEAPKPSHISQLPQVSFLAYVPPPIRSLGTESTGGTQLPALPPPLFAPVQKADAKRPETRLAKKESARPGTQMTNRASHTRTRAMNPISGFVVGKGK